MKKQKLCSVILLTRPTVSLIGRHKIFNFFMRILAFYKLTIFFFHNN